MNQIDGVTANSSSILEEIYAEDERKTILSFAWDKPGYVYTKKLLNNGNNAAYNSVLNIMNTKPVEPYIEYSIDDEDDSLYDITDSPPNNSPRYSRTPSIHNESIFELDDFEIDIIELGDISADFDSINIEYIEEAVLEGGNESAADE